MSEIYVVRHGQASFGSENYDQLSPLGHTQAQYLGEYFQQRNITFDRIVCGSLHRHKQTLEGIQTGMNSQIVGLTLPGLNEYDFSRLYRARLSEVAQHIATKDAYEIKREFYRQLRQVLSLWAAGDTSLDIAETWREFHERIVGSLELAMDGSPRRVLIVSSGGPMGIIAANALSAPDQTAVDLGLQVRNTSFCQYFAARSSPHTLRLSSFNLVPHLDQMDRVDAITFA
jgi:broad specificity phosphatase PhoE